MPIIIPAGFAHVVVEQALSGDSEPIVNTFGVSLGIAPPSSDICDDIMEAWWNAFKGVQSNAYTVTAVDLYANQSESGTEVFSSTIAPLQSTQTGVPLPQNCAALIRKRTDSAGRRGRGRFYVAGLSEADVNSVGDIATTYRNAWQTAANGFLTTLATVTGGMVILHRSEGAGTEPAPTPVEALVVETRIATQRQRLRP